jgi:heat shock protein 90kDa beta
MEIPVPEPSTDEHDTAENPDGESQRNDDEAVVDDVIEDADKTKEKAPPKMKSVTVDKWIHLNSQPPLWMRYVKFHWCHSAIFHGWLSSDPKNVSDEEYKLLYQGTFKDYNDPLSWSHFSLTMESGIAIRALLYLPASLGDNFWTSAQSKAEGVKLMVKHVFITSDFGRDALPKWASWLKAIVDGMLSPTLSNCLWHSCPQADDLPLNVSRETLQSTVFLKQIKQAIIKRLIQLFTRVAEEDSEKYSKLVKAYNTVLKLGTIEDTKNQAKLVPLIRFHTNQRNETSLDDVSIVIRVMIDNTTKCPPRISILKIRSRARSK